jgi:hypothetical protein
MTIRIRSKQIAGTIAAKLLTVDGKNISGITSSTHAVDPASIAAGAVGTATITITGLAAGDLVVAEPPALSAGLVFVGLRVTANTVTLLLANITDSPVDGASATWTIKRITG